MPNPTPPDIVERLRAVADEFAHSLRADISAPPIDKSIVEMLTEAAAEIERLRASEARMRTALEPFARIEDAAKVAEANFPSIPPTADDVVLFRFDKTAFFTVGDLRRARAALATQGEK